MAWSNSIVPHCDIESLKQYTLDKLELTFLDVVSSAVQSAYNLGANTSHIMDDVSVGYESQFEKTWAQVFRYDLAVRRKNEVV